MSVTGISKELNIPKSTVYQIVTTLVSERIVEKDSDSNLYHLGLKLFELGNLVRFNLEISKIAAPYLKELHEKYDETIHLTVLDVGEVLYVDCSESTKRLRTHSAIGEKAPLHCTGVGKAILAFLPANEIERVIQEKGLRMFTENTITDRDLLLEELKKIAQSGYAIDNMEHEEGVRCVAAPIRNHDGRVFAAISISGPAQRIIPEKDGTFAEAVKHAATKISRRLEYKP